MPRRKWLLHCLNIAIGITVVLFNSRIPLVSSSSVSSSSSSTSGSSSWYRGGSQKHFPEATSTLLRLHQHYLRQPPHDTTLYDVLQVSPNATASEISKAYRKLSRQYHPDKRRNGSDETANLDQVRQAYDVLCDDRTRLPYHRHGLIDVQDAVRILTGSGAAGSQSGDDPALLHELLLLMGYDNNGIVDHAPVWTKSRQYRVWLVASNLIELLRPVVEGALQDDAYLMDYIVQQCDRLKRLPLGAQIVRCVGRAYRYQGRRALRRYNYRGSNKHQTLSQPPWDRATSSDKPAKQRRDRMLSDWRDRVHDTVREAKHIATAAIAGGRVLWSERLMHSKRKRKQASPQPSGDVTTDNFGSAPPQPIDGPNVDDDNTWTDDTHQAALTEEDIREKEQEKADLVLLESLQIEAFWKICKVDLDRIIREACDMILNGDYFYFPSHSNALFWGGDGDGEAAVNGHPNTDNSLHKSDGWIGSSGMAIRTDEARHRTALLLVRMGDVMVQRSKQETGWME